MKYCALCTRLRGNEKTTLCHDMCVDVNNNEYKYNLVDLIRTQYHYDNVRGKKLVDFVSPQLSVLVHCRGEISARTFSELVTGK